MHRVSITTNRPDQTGLRRVVWELGGGTEFDLLDNGLLLVENREAGWQQIYNPHAWQSFYESGMEADDNTEENTDG